MQKKPTKVDDADDILEYCRENKIPFSLRQTGGTKVINCKFGTYKWYAKNGIDLKQLYFIKKVKDYCEKLKPVSYDETKISYIRRGKIKNGFLKKELFEIDLNSAYWEIAYKKGYLSKELYLQGKKVDKMVRLMALGNLAKRPTNFIFNGEKFTNIEKEDYPATAGFFFNASLETDLIMRRLAVLTEFNYLFYWVDAIFIKGIENKNRIIDYLTENKISFKIKELYKVVKNSNEIRVYHNYSDNKPKLYTFQKSLKEKQLIYFEKSDEI